MFPFWSVRLASALAVIFVAACGTGTVPNAQGFPAASRLGFREATPALSQPAIITFDTQTSSLGYFPIQHSGSQTLTPFGSSLGISDAYALAADGDLIAIVNYSPAELVTYNLKTKALNTMADPYGGPLDVAVDKNGNFYAMNLASVAVYKAGSSQAAELTCSAMDDAVAIAVDNEGDVFVNGYGPGNSMGVVEYPAGSQSCIRLHLRAERGYVAGIGVDPKTDDLIVTDDPDLCAGGLEGRMMIYPRPYEARHAVRRVLNATYCSGIFRLDADSHHIFYSDATVSAGQPIIDQARYPSGKSEGRYWEGYFSNGGFAGFTTIPNALPN
jgi:hypothetical protein